MAQVAKRIVVHGMVQGVSFRYATVEAARREGVTGWVRNRDDGSVEAWFEGPADAVDAMVRFAHDGPRHAQVDHVDVEDETPTGATGFDVR